MIWVHNMAWAVYLGGAISMELVLRHAQQFMRGSQVAVVCQNSGRKYRWLSLACLIILLVTGLMRVTWVQMTQSEMVLLFGALLLWSLLVGILALLALHIHPEMHLRVSSSMTEEEVRTERKRVGVAIQRMDFWVRAELMIAVLAMMVGTAMAI